MTAPASAQLPAVDGFSERTFYLREFRGRSIAIVLAEGSLASPGPVRDVLEAFARNETNVLLIGSDRAVLAELGVPQPVDSADPAWLVGLRQSQRAGQGLGLLVRGQDELLAACGRASQRLRLAKVVWIEESAPLERPGRGRVSFVGRRELDAWIGEHSELASAAGEGGAPAVSLALLRGVARMIDAGLPSLAMTPSASLADELFTFGGAGTLFARERYVDVHWLGLHEFDAAAELVRRGVAEGYLVQRSEGEIERVLANAFGVFVEGRYLAGIGALLPHPGTGMGEIASMYTLTRFVGEGIGAHLVRYALREARSAGLSSVFACTTSDRVVSFFERHGFERVPASEIPPQKWKGYAEERQARVHCLKKELGA